MGFRKDYKDLEIIYFTDDVYEWVIIGLLAGILASLNQRKLSTKEIEKRKKEMWKVLFWAIAIFILLIILILGFLF